MKKKLYILTLFQTLIISAFGITVTTTAPNTGVSKVMTVDNGKVYELNFNTNVLSSSKVEVNIKELGSTIASQQISTNGNQALTFTPTSNAITIEFNRINSGTATLQFEVDNIQIKEVISSKLTHEVGTKNYELSDHLGNVRTTISDKKDNGGSKVISANDYYPFGMEARSVSNPEYRFGFNTQEKDEDISQGIYTADYWKYDSRIARRWNVDPVIKPFESVYATLSGNPVAFVDVDGRDAKFTVDKDKKTVNVESTIYIGQAELAKFKKQMGDFPIDKFKSELRREDSFKVNRGSSSGSNDNSNNQNTFEAEIDGEKYTVTFSINFKVVSDQATARSMAKEDPGGNVLTFGQKGSFYARGENSSYGTIRYKPTKGAITLTHEVCHSLGLNDNFYKTENGKGNIGSYARYRKVLNSDVSLIVENAVKTANANDSSDKVFKFDAAILSVTDPKDKRKEISTLKRRK